MTTPDIAGLCENLRVMVHWLDNHDEQFVTEAADTIERQAAKIARLREALSMTKGPLGSTGPTPVYEAVLAALTGEDPGGTG